jgi:hypothetical protein
MTQNVAAIIAIIVGLIGIISGVFALFTLIRKGATTEANLRNEIKIIKTDQMEICEKVEKMETRHDGKFEIVSMRLGDLTMLERRVGTVEITNEKVDRKMDAFSTELQAIRILLERKLDRT